MSRFFLRTMVLLLLISQKTLIGNGIHSAEGLNIVDQIIKVTVAVPAPSWNISIHEIYLNDKGIVAISQLSKRPIMAAQVLSIASDQVSIKAPRLPVTHYILGKSWGWKNKENYLFIKTRSEIQQILGKANLVFKNELD